MKTEPLCITQLIRSEDFAGYCPTINYEQAIILTNDYWTQQVDGLPQFSLILATSTKSPERAVLLRVTGSAELPQSDEHLQVKVENLCRKKDVQDDTGMDALTRHQLQFHARQAKVLGCFNEENGELSLGSDIHDFASGEILNVHRPRGEALASIINFLPECEQQLAQEEAEKLGLNAPFEPYPIGYVKHSSSERQNKTKVPYYVSPQSLLNRRTAVIGKTRTGKSTLIKQLANSIMEAGAKTGHKVGQLIMDLHGEYANSNVQDNGSLAQACPEKTVVYSTHPAPGVQDFRNNFYEQLCEGMAVFRQELTAAGKTSDYIRTFTAQNFEEPSKLDHTEHARWSRRVAAYRVSLYLAGFKAPPGMKLYFCANKTVRQMVEDEAGHSFPDPGRGLTLDEAAAWFKAARAAHVKSPLPSSSGKSWADDALKNLLDMIAQKSNGTGAGISGFAILTPYKNFHSPDRATEVAQEIHQHLTNGFLVILDISKTPSEIREKLAADLAGTIFAKSLHIFTSGNQPPSILIYVEEAQHLLHGRDTNVWGKLAREGAKAGIGLVYSSQLVTGIDPQILKSTENFFITHLNCETEVRVLSQFYDLGDFHKQIINCTDPGFARARTLANKFTVPIQVNKFIPHSLRKAA